MTNRKLTDSESLKANEAVEAARRQSATDHESVSFANAKILAEQPPFEIDKTHPLVAPAVARAAELERLLIIRRANETALAELPAKLSAAELELSTFENNGPTPANIATWRAERARLADVVAGLRQLHDELVVIGRRGNY